MLHSANLQRVALKALGSCRKIGINSLFSSRLLCRCFWQQFRGATKTKITPKIAFLTRISPFVFPNLTKTLGWVGVFTDLEKLSKTKTFFFGGTPSETYLKTEQLFSDTDLSNIRDIKHILILFTKLILILLFFILIRMLCSL